jgi:hypothetical protein
MEWINLAVEGASIGTLKTQFGCHKIKEIFLKS